MALDGIGMPCQSLLVIVCCVFIERNAPKPSGGVPVASCHFLRLRQIGRVLRLLLDPPAHGRAGCFSQPLCVGG